MKIGFSFILLIFFSLNTFSQVYEGDKMYFMQSGGRDWTTNNIYSSNIEYNFTHDAFYPVFSEVGGIPRFIYLPSVGTYYIYFHTTYDAVGFVDIQYDNDGDGVEDETMHLTKTDLGGGEFSYTGEFTCYTNYVALNTAFSVGIYSFYDSYIQLNEIGKINPVSINNKNFYDDIVPIARIKNLVNWTHQITLFSDIYTQKTGHKGDNLSLPYYFCDGDGLEWVICTDLFLDNVGNEIDMRSCGFWVNLTGENPSSQIIPFPPVNDVNNWIEIDADDTSNFSLHLLGIETSSIEWTIYKYGTEDIYYTNDNATEISFKPNLYGIDNAYIGVQAHVKNLCGYGINTYTWHVKVCGGYLDISGKVERYNETDTWNLDNGSIVIGSKTASVINGSYDLSFSEGCYFVSIYDFDLGDSWFSDYSFCFYVDDTQNFYIPYGFNKTYNLSVCLFDDYLREGIENIQINMFRNSNFYELNYTDNSGCCSFTDFWYNDVILLHPLLPENKTCDDYSYVVRGNKEVNITVYNASISKQMQFRVYNKANYKAIEGAKVSCVDKINNLTYSVSIPVTGYAYLSLVLGNEYYCTASKIFFNNDTYHIQNFSQENIDSGHTFQLVLLDDVFNVHIYTYFVNEKNLGHSIINETFSLSGVEVNIEGIDNTHSFIYVVDGFSSEFLSDGAYEFTAKKRGYVFLETESDNIVRVAGNNQEIHLFLKKPNQEIDRWILYENKGFMGLFLYILDVFTGVDFSDTSSPQAIFSILIFFLPPIFFIMIFLVFVVTVRRAFGK